MVSVYIIPPVLFLLTGFFLAILSIVKGRRNYENIIFAILCICFSLLPIAFISHFIFRGDVALIMTIERAIHVFYVFLPAVSIAFFHHVLNYKNRVILLLSFLISIALSLCTFTDYYFYGLYEFSWGYIARGGPAFQFMGAYSFSVIIYVTILSIRKFRMSADPTYRMKLKYLMFSMCAMGALSLGNIPAINGINFYPVGNFSFIPMLVMAWGIYRHDIIRINQYTMQRIFGSITRAAIIVVLAVTVGLGIWIFRDYSLDHIMARTVPYGMPPLLSFLVCVFISLIGLQVGENRRESIVFSLAILVYALLSFDIYCNCIVTDQQLGLLISRINHAFLVFMPTLILHTVYLVTGRTKAGWLVSLAYVLSAGISLSTQSDLYLSGSFRYYWGFFARVGVLFNVWSLVSSLYLVYCLFLMWQSYRGALDENVKRRYLFLLIGTSATGLLTLGNVPAMLGHEIYPAGNFIFIPVILLTMGVYKYNIAELTRLGGNILYYGVLLAAVAAAAIYFPWLADRVPGPLNYAMAFSFILAFGYAWRIVHRRIFSSRKRELNRVYEDLNYRLSKCRNGREITGTLYDEIFRTILSETCIFLLHDAPAGSYSARRKAAARSTAPSCPGDGGVLPPVPRDHPLLELFFIKRRPLRQEEIEEWLLHEDRTLLPSDIIRSAAFSVPFFFEDRLLALALLGPKRDGSLYSRDEADFLNRLSLGVGPYLENANILKNLENLVRERTGDLQASELKYRHIIENAHDFIYKSDWKGNFIFVNDAFTRVLGYQRDEVLRLNYTDLVHPDRREEEFAYYRNQLKNRAPESFRQLPCVTKTGATVWIEQRVRSIFGKDGRIIEFDCIARDITERKALEESLRRSEKKYRNLVDSQLIGYYEVDLEGSFTFSNKSMASFLGYAPEALIGKNYREAMTPDSAARAFEYFGKVFTGELPLAVVELDMLHRDGHVINSESYVSLMGDEGGRPSGFAGVGIDISARKKAEEALRQSEEKYRTLLETNKAGFFEVDLAGNITFCNEVAASFMGYTVDEFIGTNFRQIMPEGSVRKVFDVYHRVYERVVKTGSVDHEINRKDGHVSYIETSVSLITDMVGNPSGFRTIAIDVSERKKAEEALRHSEELQRLVLDNVEDVVFTCGMDGRFIYGNLAARRITGYTVEEALGRNFLHFICPEDRERVLKSYRSQMKENIDVTHHEFRIVKKDGSVLWLSLTTRMVKHDDGKIDFYSVARDMTEKKKADDSRRELEAQKSRFFANVSHEIRTPLTLILAPVESYLQGDFGEVDREFFENIYRNALGLLKLINNLLDFAKIEAGKMALRVREIDPVEFMKDYLKRISDTAGSRGIALRFETSVDSMPGLYADPEKLDKLIMNLLSNALKFTDGGGSITARVRGDGVFCLIEIEDTGCGIPPEKLGRIFDRFSQAGAGAGHGIGTGIGLALAKEFAGLHGGNIGVTSRHAVRHPGDHGSVFTVTLLMGKEHFSVMDNVELVAADGIAETVSDHHFAGMRAMTELQARPEVIREGKPSSAGQGGSTILVVDDNPDMRSYFSTLLGKEYAVRFAADGAEGLETAKRIAPDLVVTDVMMPVMNGFEMTAALKADDALKTVPVIMITANAEMVNKIAGLEHGADDYLVKPFNSIELMTRIASLLKTREYQMQILLRNKEIAQELEIARLLQQRLLPERELDVPGYRAQGTYIPMDAVGGDFYDYRVREGFIDLFIADVSGHGLPGAFLSTIAKMGLDFISHRASSSGMLYRMNDLIRRCTVLNNFMTAFFCSLDTEKNVLKYCSAGHTPPLLYRQRSGEFFELGTKGKPLGWIDDPTFEEKEVSLLPGDRLVLYTDGVTECMSPAKDIFGEDRLKDLIKSSASVAPEHFSVKLVAALKGFSGSETFNDDVTLVVFDVL